MIANDIIYYAVPELQLYPVYAPIVNVLTSTGHVLYQVNNDPARRTAAVAPGFNLNAPGAALHVLASTSIIQNDAVSHGSLPRNPIVWNLVTTTLQSGPRPGVAAPPPAAPVPTVVRVTGVATATVTNAAGQSTADVPSLARPTATGSVPGVSLAPAGARAVHIGLTADQAYTVTFRSGTTPINVAVNAGSGVTDAVTTRYLDVELPPNVNPRLTVADSGVVSLASDPSGDGSFGNSIQPTVSVTGAAGLDRSGPSIVVTPTVVVPGRLSVSLSATDDGSGVRELFYSLDGRRYQPYTGTLTLDTTGIPALHVFADDRTGNRRSVRYPLPGFRIHLPAVLRQLVPGDRAFVAPARW